jgi:hypothetical protein
MTIDPKYFELIQAAIDGEIDRSNLPLTSNTYY